MHQQNNCRGNFCLGSVIVKSKVKLFALSATSACLGIYLGRLRTSPEVQKYLRYLYI